MSAWTDVDETRHVPFPNAKGLLERLQAICREHYAVGQKEFAYPGIEDDIRAENAAAKAELVGSARVPGEEG